MSNEDKTWLDRPCSHHVGKAGASDISAWAELLAEPAKLRQGTRAYNMINGDT